MLVVLIGAPASGKSSVGAGVAERWGAPFVDADVEFEQSQGQSPADFLITHGEERFREAETELSLRLLQGSGVLALTSGAVLSDVVAAALSQHRVVYLDVDARQTGRRLGLNASLPGMFAQVRSTIVKQLAERRPVYERLASIHIDTVQRTIDDVVDEVCARLA